jgi:hypothetical protein
MRSSLMVVPPFPWRHLTLYMEESSFLSPRGSILFCCSRPGNPGRRRNGYLVVVSSSMARASGPVNGSADQVVGQFEMETIRHGSASESKDGMTRIVSRFIGTGRTDRVASWTRSLPWSLISSRPFWWEWGSGSR